MKQLTTDNCNEWTRHTLILDKAMGRSDQQVVLPHNSNYQVIQTLQLADNK